MTDTTKFDDAVRSVEKLKRWHKAIEDYAVAGLTPTKIRHNLCAVEGIALPSLLDDEREKLFAELNELVQAARYQALRRWVCASTFLLIVLIFAVFLYWRFPHIRN